MRQFLVHTAIILTFYILAAYATTDILRLLKGCRTPVFTSGCFCPICRQKIPLKDQLPIFSYFINQGSCRNCKSPIPITDIFLEVFLFLFLSFLSIALHFSWTAYAFCVLCYEGTKLIFLLLYGKREQSFPRCLVISLATNGLLFSFLAFLFALEHIS